ncbi:hypothetical protein AX16_006657 [Volvariella volvacea WC 439]|nr:hypothetical protein AX16_006657 [Volvariella volvacea WC 439]
MSFPPELIDEICFHLGKDEDHSTLNACGLVSSVWNSASRPYSAFRDLLVTARNYQSLQSLLADPHSTCTKIPLRSIQFDNEDHTRPSGWLDTCISSIIQHYQPKLDTLSLHHFGFAWFPLVPEQLELLSFAPNTFILDDCHFTDIRALFSLLSRVVSNSTSHISLNCVFFRMGGLFDPDVRFIKLDPPLKRLSMTAFTNRDDNMIRCLTRTNPTMFSHVTHLTILGALAWIDKLLPLVMALQSLTITAGPGPSSGSVIDLSPHGSFQHLHLHAPDSHPSDEEHAPLTDIVELLCICIFPPSFTSLTLNVPAHRLVRPDCWSATLIRDVFDLENECFNTRLEVNVNIIESYIYRRPRVHDGYPSNSRAVTPAEASTQDLELVSRTWEEKTRAAFEVEDKRGALRLGVYRPSLNDRLSTLYRPM